MLGCPGVESQIGEVVKEQATPYKKGVTPVKKTVALPEPTEAGRREATARVFKAAEDNDASALDQAIAGGADVNAKNVNGSTALTHATNGRDDEQTKNHLKAAGATE